MEAIVLSRRDFREFDQIISLYTREYGKLELLARGVKKITSKNSAHLEPFSIVDIEIAVGKEIDHLTKVQPVAYFKNIRTDLYKSLAAQYVVSLTDKLMQVGERDERIFELLLSWLQFVNIQYPISNIQLLLDGYIVKLLYCLGFAPFQNSSFAKWKQVLQIMESGDWSLIVQLEFDSNLHKKVHGFLQYQTERQIADWTRTCII